MNRFFIATLLALVICAQGFGQDKVHGFFGRHILGKDKAVAPQALHIDIAPAFFLANGFRGNVGFGRGHWQYGLKSYSHEVYDDVQEIAFSQSEGLDVLTNTAFQGYASWFVRPDRKLFYGGFGLSPEWYGVKDPESGQKESVFATYFLMKAGLTLYPFQELFYLDLHTHFKWKMAGGNSQSLAGKEYALNGFIGIPYWSLGIRIPLNTVE